MQPRTIRAWWIAAAWVTGAVPSLAARGFAETTGAPRAADPRQQMVTLLSAAGPHAALGDQARVWDRFVGTWDCDFGFYAADGSIKRYPGELDFGWVLDGRAIQDLWILYPRNGETERGIGTSIRFLDEKARTWHVVFVDPRAAAFISVQGGVEGDRIVLRGQDLDGAEIRWSFNDIKDDSFTWRGEKSRDGGKTWRLAEEHHMRRRPSGRARVEDGGAPLPRHAAGGGVRSPEGRTAALSTRLRPRPLAR